MADSFADLPPEFRLSTEDLEMVQEEIHSKAIHFGTLETAAEAMRCWLACLKAAKAKSVARLDACDRSLRQAPLLDVDQLNRNIAAAEQRLADYAFQRATRIKGKSST